MEKDEIIVELQGAKEILLLMIGQRNLDRASIDDTLYYICRNLERMITEIESE